MNNPGAYSLTKNNGASDVTVTVAGTAICDVITDLDGMLSATVEAIFAYGSGGTSVDAYIQTSFDQGNTWVDVANFHFTTASASKIFNLSALTPQTTALVPADGSLAANTAQDGLLGDRLRAKVVSVGVYATSTTLKLRAVVR